MSSTGAAGLADTRRRLDQPTGERGARTDLLIRSCLIRLDKFRNGNTKTDDVLSAREASNFASYLKTRLAALGVRNVSFKVVGYGASMYGADVDFVAWTPSAYQRLGKSLN
jgi:hypothetical protein